MPVVTDESAAVHDSVTILAVAGRDAMSCTPNGGRGRDEHHNWRRRQCYSSAAAVCVQTAAGGIDHLKCSPRHKHTRLCAGYELRLSGASAGGETPRRRWLLGCGLGFRGVCRPATAPAIAAGWALKLSSPANVTGLLGCASGVALRLNDRCRHFSGLLSITCARPTETPLDCRSHAWNTQEYVLADNDHLAMVLAQPSGPRTRKPPALVRRRLIRRRSCCE